MAASSHIEWTDATWNPTTGCDRTSPGCDNCYALTLARRLNAMGNVRYARHGDERTSGPGFALTVHEDLLDLPTTWAAPRVIFVNSMSDLFHPDVPERFISKVFEVMEGTPRHTFQVLTKRSQRVLQLAPRLPWPGNVWMGVSIESNRYVFRADHLRRVPAAVRFLSAEPLLGRLADLDLSSIDWVIAGGESGSRARPMHPSWARDLRDRCAQAGVAFFFKQWGGWAPDEASGAAYVGEDGSVTRTEPDLLGVGAPAQMRRVGKAAAGRQLDGRTWDQMPTDCHAVSRSSMAVKAGRSATSRREHSS